MDDIRYRAHQCRPVLYKAWQFACVDAGSWAGNINRLFAMDSLRRNAEYHHAIRQKDGFINIMGNE